MTSKSRTYVALLRGINVGGRNKVPMARLRRVVSGLGFSDVRTHLQSGNVVFRTTTGAGADTPTALEARLEQALVEEFGFEVSCLVRTPAELERALATCPWPGDELDPSKVLLMFLREKPPTDFLADLDPERFAPDEFRLIDRVVYCYYPNGMGRSKLAAALSGLRPPPVMTGRNWRTIRAVVELAEQ